MDSINNPTSAVKRPASLSQQAENNAENNNSYQVYKKICRERNLTVDVLNNTHLLSSGHICNGYNSCIDDFISLLTIRTVLTSSPETLTRFQNDQTKSSLGAFNDRAIAAFNLLFNARNVLHAPQAAPQVIVPLDSPIYPESSHQSPSTPDPGLHSSPGVKTATDGVVHGTGAVAARDFRKGDEICLYDGIMTCRTRSNNQNNYHVFTIRSKSNDRLDIDFLEKDTFVAWSSVYVLKAGRPAIELGRNCHRDIRYLNHSKNANVTVCHEGPPVLSWESREDLKLSVRAQKDIQVGEELLLDYDPDRLADDIDFSPTALDKTNVEKPNSKQAKRIIERIYRLHHKSSNPKQGKSSKKPQKAILLPEALDLKIGEIIKITIDFRGNHSRPAFVDEFMEKLTPDQKELLQVLFTATEPSLEDLAAYAPLCITKTAQNASTRQLFKESIWDLKQYLIRSIFNGKNTWFTAQQLSEKLTEKLKHPGR